MDCLNSQRARVFLKHSMLKLRRRCQYRFSEEEKEVLTKFAV